MHDFKNTRASEVNLDLAIQYSHWMVSLDGIGSLLMPDVEVEDRAIDHHVNIYL